MVTDLCNFFNATGYMASAECGSHGHRWGHYGPNKYDLSPEKTFDLIACQEIVITDQ